MNQIEQVLEQVIWHYKKGLSVNKTVAHFTPIIDSMINPIKTVVHREVKILGSDLPVGSSTITDVLFQIILEVYYVSKDDLQKDIRTSPTMEARHTFYNLARRELCLPQPRIGKLLNRNHASIHSSLKAFDGLMIDDEFAAKYERCRLLLLEAIVLKKKAADTNLNQ